jgi:hypothetical protein
MKALEIKTMLADERIPEQYKLGGRLSSEFLDGVDYAEQRIMEKGVGVWLARDGDNSLYLSEEKPERHGKVRVFKCDGLSTMLSDEMFPEVTFDNSPVKARIILED